MISNPWALLQHVPHEGPGLIGPAAEAAGIELVPVRAWERDRVPGVGEVGGVVAMGGPMSVNDGAEHAWIEPEVELLGAAVRRSLPVLGVCLGAQLLARALGAEVRPGPAEEVGAGEVHLTEAGLRDPLLGPSGERLPVFHWHGETFDLPDGPESLAASDRYANQAFRAGERSWGLQFHVELDAGLAAAWRPLLPAGAAADPGRLAELERAGGTVLARFFELASGK
jgi:GMP synthase-like glutamine amidotransferase